VSLLQDILAYLDARPSQHARLIRLHTPLGPDVLIAEHLAVDEAIGPLPDGRPDTAPHPHLHDRHGAATPLLPDAGVGALPAPLQDATQGPPAAALRIVVTALSGDAHLDLAALLGEPVTVQLLTGLGADDLRPWHGHITHAARLGSDGGLARYRLVIEPWLSLLAQRVDSRVFLDRSVVQIAEEIFAPYSAGGSGQGALSPAWRWALADPAVYPQRSLSTQYRESDLAYLHRLLREEGLIYWWEHTEGSHTLVIADHNGAFAESRQSQVRFTQSGPSLAEDSLTQLHTQARVQAAQLQLASADYRTRSLRPQSQSGQTAQGNPAGLTMLSQADVPGAYAYEDDAQGQRLLARQMQAIDAQRQQSEAVGSLRSAAAGCHFTLRDHAVHDGTDPQRDRLVILRARHQARNNLHADHLAQLQAGLGPAGAQEPGEEAPLHQCQLQLQPLAMPVRMVNQHAEHAPNADAGAGTSKVVGTNTDVDPWGHHDGASTETLPSQLPDARLHPQPQVHGMQTALVVGLADPVHVDRDQRIKVQFHWQRGRRASHGLEHPDGPDNAPASDASGTWVRVATPVAGQNWGSVFTPRLGQEVLVAFANGDIERPLVVGSAYNGQGQANAQGNQRAQGRGGATGNAPAWFAGSQHGPGKGQGHGRDRGQAEGHAHGTVLAGLKTQELPSSQSGGGGHNQLVFDDSPGQGRIELSSTQAASRLQLGQLRQQADSQRLTARGHGLELASQAWGAVRAGAGLLVSAHRPNASTQAGQQLDSRAAQARLQSGQELLHTLAGSAQDHQARISGEPAVKGATETDSAKHLPTEQGLWALHKSLQGSDERRGGGGESGSNISGVSGASGDSGASAVDTIGGGTGRVTAWSRPELLLAAPSGIVQSTPASGIQSAGANVSLAAGQDVNQLAQRSWTLAAKDGIVLYTYGRASNPQRAVQHTGIALHAASGSVTSQSLTGATHVAAQQAVQIASTQADVQASAPQHVLLTAGGAGIRIEGGAITLSAPGSIVFKAGMKVLAGGASASASVNLKTPGALKGCAQRQVKGLDAITEF
jgi:type VI secretion system secreted protein VgrG